MIFVLYDSYCITGNYSLLKICIEKIIVQDTRHNSIQKIVPTINILYVMYMYINSNCHCEWQNHYNIIDWGEVSNMCGARCLIGRGEASKGARCQLGRDVWFPWSGPIQETFSQTSGSVISICHVKEPAMNTCMYGELIYICVSIIVLCFTNIFSKH